MTKQQIKRELSALAHNASVISITRVETFLGIGHDLALELTKDVPRIKVGRYEKFFIEDIANLVTSLQE